MEAHLQQSPFPTSSEQRVRPPPSDACRGEIGCQANCFCPPPTALAFAAFSLALSLSFKHCRSPLPPSSSPSLFDFLLIPTLCLLFLPPLLFVILFCVFFLFLPQREGTTVGRKDRRRRADRSMRSLLLLSLQCNKRTLPTMVRLFPSGVINIRGHRRQAAIVRQTMLQLWTFYHYRYRHLRFVAVALFANRPYF